MNFRDQLIDLAEYNVWAHERLQKWLEPQSDETLSKAIASSFPSIKKTFLHNWDAENLWHRRLLGESPTSFPSEHFDGSAQDAMAGLVAESRNWVALLNQKNFDWLAETIEYQTIKFGKYTSKRGEAAQHCLNHATYHRGQIVTIAHHLGILEAPSTDYMGWIRARIA